MPEEQKECEQQSVPRKRSPVRIIALACICILVVLIVANLDALIRPFKLLGSVLAPVTVGLIIAYLCNPFLRFFQYKIFAKVKRRMVNRALSMLFAYLVFFGIIAGIFWLVIPQVINSVNDLRDNGLSYVNRLIDSINQAIDSLPIAPRGDTDKNLVTLEKLLTFIMDRLGGYGTQLIGNIGNIASSIITVLKNILVGIFVSIYVLLSKERLGAGCRRIARAMLSEKNESLLLHYIKTAHQKFGGFLIGKIFDSMMVGIISGILFSIFHIPYAILIAVIIGVTDLIPFFGPFIGAIPSALIIFIVSPSKAFLFIILILIVQQIDGNLIAPWILGDRTGLSSLGVLVAVTVMGNLLGFAGMLIGVPLFALLITILDDYLDYRLREKNSPTSLTAYYPENAFIHPEDEADPSDTLTKKFVRWVHSVDDDPANDDPAAPRKRSPSRTFRRGCLLLERLFHKMFSIRPLPEDQCGSIYTDIQRNGIRTDCGVIRTFFLSIITVLIYPFYLIEVIAQSTNIACAQDGKRTWGGVSVFLLSLFSFGIYPVVWHCQVMNRHRNYCEAHGQSYLGSRKHFLLWTLLGFPIFVGPLIALSRFFKGFRQVAHIYNAENRPTRKRKSKS